MSTVLIVVIVVVVVAVVVALLLTRLPQARERARVQKRERELNERREQVVDEHREEAASRDRQAEVAEQRARVAAQEAERQRAESQLAEEKARLHERGLADHELIDDDERERFAGTSATEPVADEVSSTPSAAGRDRTGRGDVDTVASGANGGQDRSANRLRTVDDGDVELQRPRATAYEESQAAAHEPARAEDFEAGRRREQRR
jgi:FtsZ-interacting cell division protein ZipA